MNKSAAEKAIQQFERNAQPVSANLSNEATIGDIKKLIREISNLASALVAAIDN